MYDKSKRGCNGIRLFLCVIAWALPAVSVFGQGATRDLSDYSEPGVTFTVSIALDVPKGTISAGVEEAPPSGWVVSNISEGGSWDALTEEVKWAPLFDPFPAVVTYDVAPPANASGDLCFTGVVSFGGPEQPIDGDQCLLIGIPTLSEWGLVIMGLLVLAAGTVTLRRSVLSDPAEG